MKDGQHAFILVGRSGTGKTTLQKRSGLHCPTGCTTRPKRDGEVGYEFLTTEQYMELINSGDIVLANNIYGNWYGIRKNDIDDNVTCLVLDAVGLRQMQELYGFKNVTGIMVETDTRLISHRMHKRGSSKEEIKNRLLLDSNKFSNIYNLCDYKITNNWDVEEAVIELRGIITEVLKERV